MSQEQARRIFEALVRRGLAKEILERFFREDSCINSTRVLADVFRRMGVEAVAASVRVRIFSPRFVERAGREGSLPREPEELRAWTRQPGVWSVGIGYGSIDLPRDKWPGHLVLRAAGSCLIDATISQASRPQYEMKLPHMMLVRGAPEAFWRAEELLSADINGCLAAYESKPRDTSYLGSPAWAGRSHIEGAAADAICARLRTACAGWRPMGP